MINRVVLVGRLTRDPVVRKTNSGRSVTSFTLAVDRRRSANADPSQPTADFISCVAWSQVADLIGQYVHKGSQIGVDGRLQTRTYDDPNSPGRRVYTTEVVVENLTFLDTRNAQNANPANSGSYSGGYGNAGGYNNAPSANPYDNGSEAAGDSAADSPTLNISSDDLPF
jgi:single-strand DNA-binding protein